MSTWYRSYWKRRHDFTTKVGRVGSFVQLDQQVGALVELRCETESVAESGLFQALISTIAEHIVLANPEFLYFEDISEELLERTIVEFTAANLELGRPAPLAEKLGKGQAENSLRENCLMEQQLANDGFYTVGGLVKKTMAEIGEFIEIGAFLRYEVPTGRFD